MKKLLNKCTTCKKFTGKPYETPEAAALPQFRVRQAPPFDKVGVDFAGPLYVKKGKAMSKAYIALFFVLRNDSNPLRISRRFVCSNIQTMLKTIYCSSGKTLIDCLGQC